MNPLKTAAENAQLLRQQINQTELQLQNLKVQLHDAEVAVHEDRQLPSNGVHERDDGNGPVSANSMRVSDKTSMRLKEPGASDTPSESTRRWPLEQDEYRRYGRQLIMPQVGLKGQLRLKQAKVLIVGVGGLGCPAAAYLAGVGVGTLGLVDGDTVEISNLHRQIAHSTSRVGWSKVDSAHEFLQSYVSSLAVFRSTSNSLSV